MISSMTGFARCQEQKDNGSFTWEIRSVNHRYLEMSFRLPEGFRELEPKLRTLLQNYFQRGKVDCNFYYQPGMISEDKIVIQEHQLQQLSVAKQQIESIMGEEVDVRLTDVLKWPGVVQIQAADKTKEHETVLHLFELTLQQLSTARKEEGDKLTLLLQDRLTLIEEETKKVKEKLPTIFQQERERMMMKLDELKVGIDKNRLEQELVFYAQKIDISEELDRLAAHITETRKILKAGEACGRRLDFMMQEFNREANTLASKSVSEITTQAGVEMKVLIEQMREQVQNIE